MALLKNKDIQKMAHKEVEEKLKELRFELVRANVTANKSNAKTKEIKRAISRLLTFKASKSSQEALKKN